MFPKRWYSGSFEQLHAKKWMRSTFYFLGSFWTTVFLCGLNSIPFTTLFSLLWFYLNMISENPNLTFSEIFILMFQSPGSKYVGDNQHFIIEGAGSSRWNLLEMIMTYCDDFQIPTVRCAFAADPIQCIITPLWVLTSWGRVSDCRGSTSPPHSDFTARLVIFFPFSF